MKVPTLRVTPRLGIRMDGTEQRFTELFLTQARAAIEARGQFSFYEVGTAEGLTFSALCGLLVREGLADRSLMVSCDLPNGWSLDDAKLTRGMNASGMRWVMMGETSDVAATPPLAGCAALYRMDGRALVKLLNERHGFRPDFVFIDGCHGAPCWTADFLAVEPYVTNLALVVSHDAGAFEQGQDWQGHCQQHINVRRGLDDLGLLSNARGGWVHVEEIRGDRERGGEGHSHVVLRRTV